MSECSAVWFRMGRPTVCTIEVFDNARPPSGIIAVAYTRKQWTTGVGLRCCSQCDLAGGSVSVAALERDWQEGMCRSLHASQFLAR